MIRDWVQRAACKGRVADALFFPATAKQAEESAQTVRTMYCNVCPVAAACLSSALKNRDEGVWAGTTRATRDKLSKARGRVACPRCKAIKAATVSGHSVCLGCGASWKVRTTMGD